MTILGEHAGQEYIVFEFGLGGERMATRFGEIRHTEDEGLADLEEAIESNPQRHFKLLQRGVSPWRESFESFNREKMK